MSPAHRHSIWVLSGKTDFSSIVTRSFLSLTLSPFSIFAFFEVELIFYYLAISQGKSSKKESISLFTFLLFISFFFYSSAFFLVCPLMREDRLPCGSLTMVIFRGIFSRHYLILIIPKQVLWSTLVPFPKCFYSDSLQFLQKSPRKCWPSLKAASPFMVHPLVFLFPNAPLSPTCLIIVILSFPSQFLTLNRDRGGRAGGQDW